MVSLSPKARLYLVVVVLLLLSGRIGVAQVVTGSILGRVTDSTGAVVPGANVQIQNTDTGFSQSVRTDSEGRYLSRNLPLGSYMVSVQQEGFQTMVRRGIVLT